MADFRKTIFHFKLTPNEDWQECLALLGYDSPEMPPRFRDTWLETHTNGVTYVAVLCRIGPSSDTEQNQRHMAWHNEMLARTGYVSYRVDEMGDSYVTYYFEPVSYQDAANVGLWRRGQYMMRNMAPWPTGRSATNRMIHKCNLDILMHENCVHPGHDHTVELDMEHAIIAAIEMDEDVDEDREDGMLWVRTPVVETPDGVDRQRLLADAMQEMVGGILRRFDAENGTDFAETPFPPLSIDPNAKLKVVVEVHDQMLGTFDDMDAAVEALKEEYQRLGYTDEPNLVRLGIMSTGGDMHGAVMLDKNGRAKITTFPVSE